MNDEAKTRIRAAARARRRARLEQARALSSCAFQAFKTEEARGLLNAWRALLRYYGLTHPFLPALFLPTGTEPDIRLILDSSPSIVPALVDPSGLSLTSPNWMLHSGTQLPTPSGCRSANPDLEHAHGGPRSRPSCLLGAEALAEADIILVPALAVDTLGNRIGQGGGWYDRALLHARPWSPKVAVLFDEEVSFSPLPVMAHDQKVQAIVTPSGYRILKEAEGEAAHKYPGS